MYMLMDVHVYLHVYIYSLSRFRPTQTGLAGGLSVYVIGPHGPVEPPVWRSLNSSDDDDDVLLT